MNATIIFVLLFGLMLTGMPVSISLGLTVPAIAATLGVREGTVKSRLHRALRGLRTGLLEQEQ